MITARQVEKSILPKFLAVLTIILPLSSCSTGGGDTTTPRGEDSQGSKTSDSANTGPEPSYEDIIVTKSEMDIEQEELVAKARKLLHEKNYAELDKMIDSLVSTKANSPNGRWKLDLLYMEFTDPEKAGKKPTAEEWQKLLAEFKGWHEANKKSSNALIALAEAETGYAWHARGSGYADTVTDEGWKKMGERLQEAASYLKMAKELNTKNPRLWSAAASIGLGQGMENEEFEALVKDALRSEPTYEVILFDRTNYLRPRWHGNEGDWERAAKEAADQLPGAEGDKRYARIMWAAHSLGECRKLYLNKSIDWDRIKRGFVLLEKENPNSLATTSRFCALAVSAGDMPQARELFDKLHGRMTESAWKSKKYFSQSRDWAYAMKRQ